MREFLCEEGAISAVRTPVLYPDEGQGFIEGEVEWLHLCALLLGWSTSVHVP